MKFISIFSLIIIGIPLIICVVIFGLIFSFKYIYAEEYTPLDFADQYSNFEVVIGFDESGDRYASYNYEFKD